MELSAAVLNQQNESTGREMSAPAADIVPESEYLKHHTRGCCVELMFSSIDTIDLQRQFSFVSLCEAKTTQREKQIQQFTNSKI